MARLALLALVLFGLPSTWGWKFSLSTTPAQCTPFSISFSGGVPPYQFTILRLASLDGSLPMDQWGNGSAIVMNFTASPAEWGDLPWRADDPIVVVGSDATGFGTGGTSDVLTIGDNPASDSDSCIQESTNSSYVDNVISWNGAVAQCGVMSAVFTGVQNPVSVAVVVPGGVDGESYVNDTSALGAVNVSATGIELAWYMTVSAGDQAAFFAFDSNGPLFVSTLFTVQPGPLACLDYLISTTEWSSATETSSSEATATAEATTTPGSSTAPTAGAGSEGNTGSTTSGGSSGPNIGAIVGGVVGGVGGIILITGIVMYIMHRYNRHQLLLRRQTYGIAAYSRSRPTPSPPTPRSLEGEVRLKDLGKEAGQSAI